MLEKFLPRMEFDSYEDFKANYSVNLPDNFNFAYDVMDAWASVCPDKTALVWCDDNGGDKVFSFADIKRLSDKAANFFASHNIHKGDVVMTLLKRRWHYWICTLALEKIGAISIPATVQLTKKDIIYRNNSASVKMIVSVTENEIVSFVEAALAESPTVTCKALVGGGKDGWIDLTRSWRALRGIGPDRSEAKLPAVATIC